MCKRSRLYQHLSGKETLKWISYIICFSCLSSVWRAGSPRRATHVCSVKFTNQSTRKGFVRKAIVNYVDAFWLLLQSSRRQGRLHACFFHTLLYMAIFNHLSLPPSQYISLLTSDVERNTNVQIKAHRSSYRGPWPWWDKGRVRLFKSRNTWATLPHPRERRTTSQCILVPMGLAAWHNRLRRGSVTLVPRVLNTRPNLRELYMSGPILSKSTSKTWSVLNLMWMYLLTDTYINEAGLYIYVRIRMCMCERRLKYATCYLYLFFFN